MSDSNTNVSIDDIIRDNVESLLAEKLPTILDKAIENALQDACDNSFRWGKPKKAIEEKLNEILVPAIESYNLSNYNVKLGIFLEQLMNETAIDDTRKLLQNFHGIISDENTGTILASEILKAYAEHCAYEFSCDGREVDNENETYQNFAVCADIEQEYNHTSRYYTGEDAILKLYIEDEYESDADNSKLNYEIRMWRTSSDAPNQWRPLVRRDYTIGEIQNMSHFDILILKLSQNKTKIINNLDEYNSDIEVTPEDTPEWVLE